MNNLESTLNVCYAMDNNYVMQTGVSMVSLMKNNKDYHNINIFILSDNINDSNKDKLNITVEQYKRNIYFIEVSEKIKTLKGVNAWVNGSFAHFARIFIPELITDMSIQRVLYLDGDTIINGSLQELIKMDMCNKPFAVNRGMWGDTYYKKLIGLSADDDYCTTGVMLIDLSKWREEKCLERIIYHIDNVRAKYPFPDQDLINVALKGFYTIIDLKFNYGHESSLFEPEDMLKLYGFTEKKYYSIETIKYANCKPVIIHYSYFFTARPWFDIPKKMQTKFVPIWDKYLKITVWRDYKKTPYSIPFIRRLYMIFYKVCPKSLFFLISRVALRTLKTVWWYRSDK